MSARLLALVLAVAVMLVPAAGAADWRILSVARFGNIDATDAEDGELALFLKSVRNDGRFIPPMRTLVGPEIRNPTFFGISYEAWMEGVVMVPAEPGPPELLWIFPVDDRDEYMAQLASIGLAEYEGIDGVSVLREIDRDGNVRTWHLEWLPGNVAVFGVDRSAVTAGRQVYAENSAARGLLFGTGGQFMQPDVLVRLFPPAIAAWQDEEPGRYWWREKVAKLSDDLVSYWSPGSARIRLLDSLSERLAVWPRNLQTVDVSIWFENAGVEWRLEIDCEKERGLRSQLGVLRRMPARTALAYAIPLSRESFREMGEWAGALLLGAAGGAVTQDARAEADRLFASLMLADPREAASGWVPPPAGSPELGGARILVVRWERPEMLTGAWTSFTESLAPGSPLVQTFAQIGWKVVVRAVDGDPLAAEVEILPGGGGDRAPYYSAVFICRMDGDTLALVGGTGRNDPEQLRKVVEYRTEMAAEAVANGSAGSVDARGAFVRMGSGGASILGYFEPVRFAQFALVESADWRPRSPDQHEPQSAQLAREMLEYGSAGAWTFAGESDRNRWRFSGGISWQSLARLSAALGITESIGME